MRILFILLTFLLWQFPAYAILGEKYSTQKTWAGTASNSTASVKRLVAKMSTAQTYSVESYVIAGITVREYLLPTGVVCAVTWDGIFYPDLSQLLGSYADEYREKSKEQGKKVGAKRSQVKSDNIVVEKWGRGRSLGGRAYLPNLFPEGVELDEIQ